MRDYRADANDKAHQTAALLRAWLDDLNRVDGTSELHDALVIALADAQRLVHTVEALPRSPSRAWSHKNQGSPEAARPPAR